LSIKNAPFRPLCVDFTRSVSSIETGSQPRIGLALFGNRKRLARNKNSRSASGRGVSAGAVRLNAEPEPQFGHSRKLTAALVAIAGGILWTTTSTGTVEEVAPAITRIAKLVQPTFFFDDSSDALNSPGYSTRFQAAMNGFTKPGTELVQDDAATLAAEMPLFGELDALTPEGRADAPRTITVSNLVNHPALQAVKQQAEGPTGATKTAVKIASGDTLSGVLNDHGVKIEHMPQLLTDDIVKKHLSNLKIGQELMITQMPNGDFHSLSAKVGKNKRITVRRSANDFAVASIDLPVEKERVVTSGTIEQSLYLAAEEADLKQSTIMELARIFQWELDFARDIRKGDHFSIVYDRLYREGKYIGDGDILAAEFVRGGRTHRAIRFTSNEGHTGYYSPDGQSKRRTFMRHPVDVVRITSHFDPNRMHPVLHKIRAHRGVDYGSPHGSPIYATADGVVKFSGTKTSYGKTVVLQHGDNISTLYAHMSRISDKSKVGKRVNQGDVIGYVGRTGRVTGTHLHYEFRKNGTHVDPLKIELPAASPIAKAYRSELKAVSDEMIAQMRSVMPTADSEERVAQLKDAN